MTSDNLMNIFDLNDDAESRVHQSCHIFNWYGMVEDIGKQIIRKIRQEHGLQCPVDDIIKNMPFISNVDIRIKLQEYISCTIVSKCSLLNKKAADKCNQFRLDGNVYYKKALPCHLMESIRLYNQAIRYGPRSSEPLALAYGNRSASYYHLDQYHLSILDVELAIENGYQKFRPNASSKLLFRKFNCFIKLKKYNQAKQFFHDIQANLSSSEKHNFIEQFQVLDGKEDLQIDNSIDCQKNRFQSLFWQKYGYRFGLGLFHDKVEACVDLDGPKGRYLRAKQDIQPGEIIIIEQPYVQVLLQAYELQYCHHCCKKLNSLQFATIACYNCTNVFYCSKDCLDASWKLYHKMECSILPFLHQFGIGHLVIRIFLITHWPHMMDCFQQFKQDPKRQTNSLEAFQMIKSTDNLRMNYDSLLSLLDHQDQFDCVNILSLKITSLMIVEILLTQSYWQERVDDKQLNVAFEIALRHLCQTITNGHAISDYLPIQNHVQQSQDQRATYKMECHRIATGLYPSISLLNHSCSPNVVATFQQGTFNVVRASKVILTGQDICNCYGCHFSKYNYIERSQLLESQYFFSCCCEICQFERNKPPDEVDFQFPNPLEDINKLRFCSKTLDSFGKLLLDEFGILKNCQPIRARKLLRLGEMLDQLSCYYLNEYGNLEESYQYCQYSNECVEMIYGKSSIELCNEQIKLIDLANLMYEAGRISLVKFKNHIKRALYLLKLFTITLTDNNEMIEMQHDSYFQHELVRLQKLLLSLN